jgi:isoquinoline 1-oxidoreductase alpha subunit
MAIKLTVNGERRSYGGDPEMPLLWYLRDELGLVGSKFGCGIASCGACTVHVDGTAARSCSLPMSSANGTRITTIEGLAAKDGRLHAVQQAWIDEDVAQCGYCQAGQIMAVVELLKSNPNPSDDHIDAGITNLCRCGSYARLRKAVHVAAKSMREA